MNTDYGSLKKNLESRFQDRRTALAEIELSPSGENALRLSGKVLDGQTLTAILVELASILPDWVIDTDEVRVLRQHSPKWMNVAVNLSGLYTQPSWQAEMISQNTFGAELEVLEEQDNWAFVRQMDGYLGWMYQPYLSEINLSQPTHLVRKPFALLYEQPETSSLLTARLPAGAAVTVSEQLGNWFKIEPHPSDLPCRMPGGWVIQPSLRRLSDLPRSAAEKRNAILDTAFSLFGVPYLWGGTTANGIDCSGLAQLCYHMVGGTLPRDGDMQKAAGRPLEAPFTPGDLLFFTEEDDCSKISHVAISLGDWQIIHSSRRRNGVAVDDVRAVEHLRNDFAGACTYFDPEK